MEEAAGTVTEAGVQPLMVDAIIRRMDWSSQLGLREMFGGQPPKTYRDFAARVAEAGQQENSSRFTRLPDETQ